MNLGMRRQETSRGWVVGGMVMVMVMVMMRTTTMIGENFAYIDGNDGDDCAPDKDGSTMNSL